jgi:hypothetical protein
VLFRVIISSVVHVELLSKHSVAFPVILQDPPGSFSVNEEWNVLKYCRKTVLFRVIISSRYLSYC